MVVMARRDVLNLFSMLLEDCTSGKSVKDAYEFYMSHVQGTKTARHFSQYLWVFRDGVHIPFDTTFLDGKMYHSDPKHGGVVLYRPEKTLKDLNDICPVWYILRGSEINCRPGNSDAKSILLMERRREHSEREDQERRVAGRSFLNNANADPDKRCLTMPSGAKCDISDTLRTYKASRLPCFQPWMVGGSKDIYYDRSTVEVLPTWFVFSNSVSKDNIDVFERFLTSRYSEFDWNRMCEDIVPFRVFDDCCRRYHYQNVRGKVFLRMRLLFCIERHRPHELSEAVESSDLCKYYKDAFLT